MSAELCSPVSQLPHQRPPLATLEERQNAILGSSLFVYSLFALGVFIFKRPHSFSGQYRWRNRIWVIGSGQAVFTLMLASAHTLPIALRAVVVKLIYPLEGHCEADSPATRAWEGSEVEQPVVITSGGLVVNTRKLLGSHDGEHFGEVVVLSPGNATLYEHYTPEEFTPLTAKGYDVVVFHPPGYGKTPGPRTPAADYAALKAVIEWVLASGTPIERVTLIGGSIGSGAATAVSADYPLSHLVLVVPFARLSDVVVRGAMNLFGKRLGSAIGATVREHVEAGFEYDNERVIRYCRAERVSIVSATEDYLMSVGEEPTESAKLCRAYTDSHTGGKVVDLMVQGVGHAAELFWKVGTAADLLERACLGHEHFNASAEENSSDPSGESPVQSQEIGGGRTILLRLYRSIAREGDEHR